MKPAKTGRSSPPEECEYVFNSLKDLSKSWYVKVPSWYHLRCGAQSLPKRPHYAAQMGSASADRPVLCGSQSFCNVRKYLASYGRSNEKQTFTTKFTTITFINLSNQNTRLHFSVYLWRSGKLGLCNSATFF